MASASPLALARRLVRRPPPPATGTDVVRFRCNLCGTENHVPAARISREVSSCWKCLSTVRFRAMAHLVVREMLGVEAALPDLAARRDVAGIGLSDDARYARPLARVFAYENTFFHRRPRLDITAIPPERQERYDFAIASDVFEHVVPPVSRAFEGARALLKPRGVLVFSVPYNVEGETIEHFPQLHDWSLEQRDGAWRLTNVTSDGRRETFDDLVFHGGPGSTLEMRVFTLADLRRHFAAAGFARVRVASEACAPFGIEWSDPLSVPLVAHVD